MPEEPTSGHIVLCATCTHKRGSLDQHTPRVGPNRLLRTVYHEGRYSEYLFDKFFSSWTQQYSGPIELSVGFKEKGSDVVSKFGGSFGAG